MTRNFGIPNVTNRPASSGAQQTQAGSHYSAGARAGSNVIELFPSAPETVDSSDADFGALCFALASFVAVILVGGFLLSLGFAFF